MSSFYTLLFLLWLGFAISRNGILGDLKHCSQYKPKGDALRFTDPGGPATLAIGCDRNWLDLSCCAVNFRQIIWYQKTDDERTWVDFMSVKTNSKNISEDGQVATITNLDQSKDRGLYKCIAFGHQEGKAIENVVKLIILDCSSWSDSPLWLNPNVEEKHISASIGQSISITCSTFSGTNCQSDLQCKSFWFKPPFDEIPENNSTVHVSYTYIYRPNSFIMESILNIVNITESEFRSYNCAAANGNGFAKDRIIYLQKSKIDVFVPVTAAVAGGVLLIIVLAGLLVNYRTRVDLDLKIWLAKRRLKEARKTEKTDVTLLYIAEDQSFARYLRIILETKFNFSVVSPEEVQPGEAPHTRLPELAMQSRSVMVLLTPEMTRDGEMVAIIGDIISHVTPAFIISGMENAMVQLDQNIQGALNISKPLLWPEIVNTPTDPNLDEWEKISQVNLFLKKLHLSLLKRMDPTKSKPKERVSRENSTGPLLTPTSPSPQDPIL